MPVVSAVLHVAPEHLANLIDELSADERLTVGVPAVDRLPVVASTLDRRADKAVWKTIETRRDVRFIELAFADFSDIHPHNEVD